MFKRITIHLTGPVCRCDSENLSWAVIKAPEDKSILEILCKTCGTRLIVPHDNFVAAFHFDEQYPAQIRMAAEREEAQNDRRFLESLNISGEDPPGEDG